MAKLIYEGKMEKQKETKGTVVFYSPKFGSIYVPKLLLPDSMPAEISVKIEG